MNRAYIVDQHNSDLHGLVGDLIESNWTIDYIPVYGSLGQELQRIAAGRHGWAKLDIPGYGIATFDINDVKPCDLPPVSTKAYEELFI